MVEYDAEIITLSGEEEKDFIKKLANNKNLVGSLLIIMEDRPDCQKVYVFMGGMSNEQVKFMLEQAQIQLDALTEQPKGKVN